MLRSVALPALVVNLVLVSTAQTSAPAPTTSDVAATVARMARIGSASRPTFSPDGKWLSYISNISGMPQVWIVPAEGGYPRMVTNGDDPVVDAEWSPASDWLAVTIAPGGGLNTKGYAVKLTGTGLRRRTGGGKRDTGIQ